MRDPVTQGLSPYFRVILQSTSIFTGGLDGANLFFLYFTCYYSLFARAMDIERVNIVFDNDMPEDSDTYLHRVARAGRFGTKDLSITFVTDDSDQKILQKSQRRLDVEILVLPDGIEILSHIESRDN